MKLRVLLVGALSISLWACPSRDSKEPDRGAQLYESLGCAACHGRDGRGRDMATLAVRPRDFTRPEEFKVPRTVEALAQVIADGSGTMPSYKFLAQADREALAAFVLRFAAAPTPGANP